MKRNVLRFLGESTLWSVANALCMALPLLAVYLVGTMVLGWSPWRLSMFMGLTAALTATWGSWATLIWTRNRFLRSLQQGITTLPGITLFSLGAALFYVGIGKWYLSLLLVAGGLGLIATAVMLAGGFFSKNETPSRLQYLFGLLVFPVATTGVAGLVASLWFSFLSSAAFGSIELRLPFNIGAVMSSIMAAALLSTLVPAAMSRACQLWSASIDRMR